MECAGQDLGRARALLKSGAAADWSEAGDLLERALAVEVKDPGCLEDLSSLLLQAGRFETARRAAERWLALEKTPASLRRLGECLRELAQYEKALLYFQRALHRDKTDVHALCQAGSCLISSGCVVKGLIFAGRALHEDEACAQAHRLLAVGLLRQGSLEQAEAAALEAVRLKPESAENTAVLGLARMKQGRADEALELLRRAVEIRPLYAEGWANLGYVLMKAGAFAEAAQVLRRSASIKPFKAETHNTLANALRSMGRLEEARESLARACQLAPKHPDFQTNLGVVLSDLRRYDESVEALNQALRLDPGHLQARSSLPMLHVLAGRLEQALAEARELVRRHPEFAGGHHNLAAICNKLDRLDEAEAEAERAAELAPQVQRHHRSLAEILKRQGKLDKALGAALTALSLEDNAKARFRLGLILRERGELDEAVKNFRRSLELDPEDNEGASIFLAALGGGGSPEAAPQGYIRRVFDSYAVRFDEHLVKGLRYEAPWRFMEALAPHLSGARGLRVLDLGCGTGLCGRLLRPLAVNLEGVDLSERMIEQAGRSGVYDRLEVGDAIQALRQRRDLDLVAAGDLLIYLGDLGPIFSALAGALGKGGLFVGNVEALGEEGWSINPAGRYAHSEAYVRRVVQEAGLSVLSLAPACLREEDKQPVPGYLMVLQAPECPAAYSLDKFPAGD